MYLDMHPYEPWTSNKGKYCVRIPDPTKARGVAVRRRATLREIEDLIIQYQKDQIESPTIEEVFTEWNDRRLELNKIRPATHTRDKKAFNRFYSEFGKKKIRSVTSEDIADFLEAQISKHQLKAKAFAGLKGITKGFLLRAKKRKLITWNVTEMLETLDVSDKQFVPNVIEDEKEIFYDDEMTDILEYCRKYPELKNLGVALIFVTGIRVGELVALKHSDVDGLCLNVQRTETTYYDLDGKRVVEVQDSTKTKAGMREVIVPQKYKWIMDKLKLCNPFGEYIFVSDDGARMNTGMIRKRIGLICDKCNILKRSPHKARKTYGSILLDNNVDYKFIEKQMGHTDIMTTEHYYHRDRKRRSEKERIINSIPEFASNY